jgi:5-formyltetrahydrofolate cyclo-ligase
MLSPAKTELRRRLRAQLARMAPTAMMAASESVRTSIPLLPRWQEARVVAAYVALPGEPDLRPLDWVGERTVLLPRVDGENLVFHRVESPGQLRPGAFSVFEPDAALCPVVSPSEAEVIFVPGMAFTVDGARLGRGRGFYDRLLAELPRSVLRAGVCFPGQVLDVLPVESHDELVDVVLTAPA